jgi:hypothetical protein
MKHFTGIMFALAVALGLSGTVHAQYVMKISTPTVGDINVEWMKTFKAGFEATRFHVAERRRRCAGYH